jgi:hypothetical protein
VRPRELVNAPDQAVFAEGGVAAGIALEMTFW